MPSYSSTHIESGLLAMKRRLLDARDKATGNPTAFTIADSNLATFNEVIGLMAQHGGFDTKELAIKVNSFVGTLKSRETRYVLKARGKNGQTIDLDCVTIEKGEDLFAELIASDEYDVLALYARHRAGPRGEGAYRTWGKDVDLVTGISYEKVA